MSLSITLDLDTRTVDDTAVFIHDDEDDRRPSVSVVLDDNLVVLTRRGDDMVALLRHLADRIVTELAAAGHPYPLPPLEDDDDGPTTLVIGPAPIMSPAPIVGLPSLYPDRGRR
jgi:hypothetical protein